MRRTRQLLDHRPRLGGLALVAAGAAAVVGLAAGTAQAVEFGNHNFAGILSSTAPSGYPVSPAAMDLSHGPVTVTVSVTVTNLTGTAQSLPISFVVDHILTYQGVDVSDGQPGQAGITFPAGAAKMTTQARYGTVQTATLSVGPNAVTTLSFPMTISNCGYYQVDFFHHFTTGTVYLAAGFTRALGCSYGPRLTPGYWKNHAAATTALLPQTLGGYQVTTDAQAVAIFDAMKCSSPANCLAGHLLAAELDIAGGASSCIASTVADANNLLSSIGYAGVGSYTLSPAQATQALTDESLLDSYTNDSTSGTC